RLDAQRQTTTSDNRPVTPGAKVERKDTRIVVAFYNLANVPPRVTSTANIACEDVEATHRTIGERVIKAGGRVISSNVNRQQANRASATMQFEVKSDQADAVLNDLRAAGELMKLESIQNNDTNSVTDAKRGFAVQLVSIASATPRQVTTKSVAASDVPTAYNVLLDEAGKVNARIVVSKLQQDSNQPANAWLDFEVRKTDAAAIDAAIAGAGDSIGGDVTVSTDVANTLASKVQYKIALSSADQLPPREVTTLAVETRDVEESVAAIVKAASEAGGRAIDSNVSKESSGRTMARLTIDVPLNRSGEMLERVKSRGVVRVSQSTKNAKAAGGQLARARIDVTFGTPEAIVGADAGVWATIRNGLSTSAAGLMWSLRLLVIGVCLIAPWAVAVWGGWKIARRVRASKAVA
ncbi:MAG: DUF4349 domain-containing protein, partial [Burkholderiales bacterium]|nr:DUF4349 domain-containing protein [Phycisphaerae bacterium]